MGYLRRLWRGDVALLIVFWVYGIFLGSALAIISNYLTEYDAYISATNGGYESSDLSFLIFYSLYGLFFLSFNIFILVAVWRSASRYKGPGVWAVLAKAFVVIAVLNAGLTIGKLL